jgi:hypothetical protein
MKTNILVLYVVTAMLIGGCNVAQTAPAEQREQERQFQAQQASVDQLAKATDARFNNMPVTELLVALEQAAVKGREPFNSPAYREIIKRKNVVEPLFRSIVDSSQKEYFKLMALKKLDAASYARIPAQQGAAILTDALAKSESFNAWGIPNHYWESSAKALIDYGANAVPYLDGLLDDKRAAPVWGSEEAMIYEQYKFRVCDYALALLNEISPRQKIELPAAPDGRDSLIALYKRSR